MTPLTRRARITAQMQEIEMEIKRLQGMWSDLSIQKIVINQKEWSALPDIPAPKRIETAVRMPEEGAT